MKRILLGFLAVFLAFAVFSSAEVVSVGSALRIENVSLHSPYPAEPGKYVDVSLSVQNPLDQALYGTECELKPEYPFSLDANENAYRSIGTLSSKTSVILRYKVRVAIDAVEGNNVLKIKCRTATTDWTVGEYKIYVQTSDPVVSVEAVSTTPGQFEQGKTGTIDLTLKNLANAYLRDVSVKIDMALSSIPFAPIDSTSEKRISLISPQDVFNVQFKVATLPGADSDIFKIPLEVSYLDSLGKRYVRNYTVSLTVGGKPDIGVGMESTNIIHEGMRGTVVVKIVNKGLIDVKFLNVRLLPSNDYTIISSDNDYVGKVNSDDTETSDFIVYLNSGLKDVVAIPVEVTYRDANNNVYTQKESIPLRLYSPEEIKKLQLEQQSGPSILLIAGVLVVAGYVFYRVFLHKKRLR
ncbi:hypothetical protein HY991_03940 [Candidatus Micrarchaeota archaeon]|nr:hypothetical protein [Candidatus Micrarchaeota archaeon]